MIPGLPLEYQSDDKLLPPVIHGYVSVKGKRSVFTEKWDKLPDTPMPFSATKNDRDTTRRDLETSGLTVVAESQLGFSVVGPAAAYEAITGGRIEAKERLMMAEEGCVRYVTHLDVVGNAQPRALGAARVESDNLKADGMFLERPKVYTWVYPSPVPPVVPRFYLRLPYDVSSLYGAQYAHQAGFRGEGVQIAMPDSGQYRHPFFLAHKYSLQQPIAMVPGTDPGKDPVGHGTGESANIFALAPGAVVQPIRASNNKGDLVAAVGSLLKAKELKPQIITNSWGGDVDYPPSGSPDAVDLALALEIQDAIDQGILVIFSAGNGQFSVEPQVPGVLSAGGVYFGPDYQLQASDYASGYDSPWFAGVRVPSACGLVGMLPRAQYLMLPVPPGSPLDVDESHPAFPDDLFGDGTSPSDGWALFSGTSAAAPQLAGVAALILGAFPALKPAQVIEAMTMSAIDVSRGMGHPRFGNLADIGPDAATGAGLVNAVTALRYAFTHFSSAS